MLDVEIALGEAVCPLTPALSPEGRGGLFVVDGGFSWRKRLCEACVVFGWGYGGLGFPASAGIPRCRFAPAPPSLCERGVPPLSFGHFPRERGKP